MIVKSQYQHPKVSSPELTPKNQLENTKLPEWIIQWILGEERYVCQIKSSNYAIHSDNDISVAVQNTGEIFPRNC